MSERTNILLIVADQLTPFTTGAYGHARVRTPNMDALAADGIRFDAAYTSCPLCAPARASLVTGRYASNIGVYDNKSSFSCEEPTFAHYLAAAGYDTVLSGKIHFVGADQLHGFDRRLITDIFPADFSWQKTDKRESPQDEHAKHYLTAGPVSWSKNATYDAETHFQALKYLHSTPQNPFLLCVSYQQPHQPFMVSPEVWAMYADEDIDLPDLPDDIHNLDATYSAMDRSINRFHGIPPVREELLQPETLRRMRRAYFGMVSEIDRKIGNLLHALDETGQRENTVILFLSDHGDMLGEHGLIQKRYFYDYSARIPLIVTFPDGRRAGEVCPKPVSIVDIAPTICDIVGAAPVTPFDGVSVLQPLQADRVVFAEQHVEGVDVPCFMARDDRYKLIYVHGIESQLFDLEADTHEWRDLSGNPAHAEAKSRLEKAIRNAFDPDAIDADIRASLRKRHLIRLAMKANHTRWDYVPDFKAAERRTSNT